MISEAVARGAMSVGAVIVQPCSREWPHDVTEGFDTSSLNQGLL